jgi:integrase
MSIIKYPRRIPVNAARAAISSDQTANSQIVSGLLRGTTTEPERGQLTDQEPTNDLFDAAALAPITIDTLKRHRQRKLQSDYNGTTLSRLSRRRISRPLRAVPVKPVPAVPTYGEIRHILSVSRDDPQMNDLHDVVAIILETGIRKGELEELRWSDADLDHSQLVVRSPKCGKIQIVLLRPETVRILKSRRENRHESEFVLGSSPRNLLCRVTRQLRDLCEKNGVNRISLHDLRRAYVLGRIPHSEASPSTVKAAGGWLTM